MLRSRITDSIVATVAALTCACGALAASPVSMSVPLGAAQAASSIAPSLDLYVGHYVIGDRQILQISQRDATLFAQMPGRRPMQIVAAGGNDFTGRYARFTFLRNDQQPAHGVVIQQSGREIQGTRVTTAIAGQLEQRLGERIRSGQNTAGEASVEALLVSIASGAPDYNLLTEPFRSTLQENLAKMQAKLGTLGQLQSITPRGIGPRGADIYLAVFENGSMECHIATSATTGQITGFTMRRAP